MCPAAPICYCSLPCSCYCCCSPFSAWTEPPIGRFEYSALGSVIMKDDARMKGKCDSNNRQPMSGTVDAVGTGRYVVGSAMKRARESRSARPRRRRWGFSFHRLANLRYAPFPVPYVPYPYNELAFFFEPRSKVMVGAFQCPVHSTLSNKMTNESVGPARHVSRAHRMVCIAYIHRNVI